ncbi:TPA: hypothetical protein ACS7ZB_003186 [Providencia alcalifaciens]
MPISSISSTSQNLYTQNENSIKNQKDLFTGKKNEHSIFLEHLMAVAGPSRFGANALTFAQLDRSMDIIKPQVISDHMPIFYSFPSEKNNTKIFSWNLLADTHKNNNYQNIEIPKSIYTIPKNELEYFYTKNKISATWLYYDLSTEIYLSKNFSKKNIINEILLGSNKGVEYLLSFLNKEYKQSRLADLKKGHQDIEQSLRNREIARNSLIKNINSLPHNELCNSDIYSSIVKALKINHTINNGSLSIANREKTLINNDKLLRKISENDFLILQECFNPKSINEKINTQTINNKKFNYIEHKCNNSDDYCSIMYDSSKYTAKCVEKSHLGRNKPCIMGLFTNNTNNHSLIMCSIHYPGEEKNTENLSKIISLIDRVNIDNTEDIYIGGDFNQIKSELETKYNLLPSITSKALGLKIISAQGASMSGPDWNGAYQGKTIDHMLTNQQGKAKALDIKYLK